MRYGSVCSGIEAATVAWHPLGWQPSFFSEIDAFPRAVLAHHYPAVPCHGDFTTIGADTYAAIDVLVGGTPCQSFSVAGLRAGLDDERGNLALEFCKLARRLGPRWVVWENVPGVLSLDGGRAFASILGGLADCGYGLAYRVLDAQFVRVDGFGRAVPQRRRRVFVVGCLGDWRRAAAVLFERASLRGDPAPRREAGQGIAGTVTARVGSGVGADENHARDGHLVANTMSSKWAKGRGGYAGQNETDNCCIVPAQDPANCLGAAPAAHTSHGEGQTNYAIVAGCASTLNANYGSKWGLDDQHINQGAPLFVAQGVAHALRADGFDASEDGTGRGTPVIPILEIGKGSSSRGVGPNGSGIGADGDPMFTLQAGAQHAVAFAENSRAEVRMMDGDGGIAPQLTTGGGKPGQGQPCIAFHASQDPDVSGDLAHPLGNQHNGMSNGVFTGWRVRRLMPVECERLQGFPDGYTAIPYRGKAAADGPRYKALGNSMAVNCMRWIGRRIEQVERIA